MLVSANTTIWAMCGLYLLPTAIGCEQAKQSATLADASVTLAGLRWHEHRPETHARCMAIVSRSGFPVLLNEFFSMRLKYLGRSFVYMSR